MTSVCFMIGSPSPQLGVFWQEHVVSLVVDILNPCSGKGIQRSLPHHQNENKGTLGLPRKYPSPLFCFLLKNTINIFVIFLVFTIGMLTMRWIYHLYFYIIFICNTKLDKILFSTFCNLIEIDSTLVQYCPHVRLRQGRATDCQGLT